MDSETLADGVRRKYKLSRDRLRTLKRQVLRLPAAPKLVAAHAAYGRAVKRRDWPLALERARRLGELATIRKDRRMIREAMEALERFQCFEDSARLQLAWRDLLPGTRPNEWRGEDLSGKTLMVDFTDKYERNFGYRGVSLVAKAARLARHVVVVAEPRIVPTYRRTFPALEIVDTVDEGEKEKADHIATLGILAALLGPRGEKPGPAFQPLIPDGAMVSALRERYRDGDARPLIGIFWYSTHHGKDLPSLAEWRAFIDDYDARFISLQYGDVRDDVAILGPDRVIVDPAIDQFADLDGFAAQVAALDAVVGISGTTVHVAGALGVPTALLRDDWFRRQWPVMSDRVPWYPNLRVVGKDGRNWNEVFDEAWGRVEGLLADGGQWSQPVTSDS